MTETIEEETGNNDYLEHSLSTHAQLDFQSFSNFTNHNI